MKKNSTVKWIGISGSWRTVTKDIEQEVRKVVRAIMTHGDGIVSGGALGVDFIATDEALIHNPKADRIKIFIPTTLEKFSEHYRKHSHLGTITTKQAESIISQLKKIKQVNSDAISENTSSDFTEETKKERYYERNSKIVESSNELVAFRVKTDMSESLGTADTVEKAHQRGIPVKLFTYNLKSNVIIPFPKPVGIRKKIKNGELGNKEIFKKQSSN